MNKKMIQRAVVILAMLLTACSVLAQTTSENARRFELSAQYSYWSLHGSVAGHAYKPVSAGAEYSAAYFFNRNWGMKLDYDYHVANPTDGGFAIAVGPVYRYPTRNYSAFAHFLIGAAKISGPDEASPSNSSFYYNPCKFGPQVTIGGGIDVPVHAWHEHFAIRVAQLDYEHQSINYGALQPTTGGKASINTFRFGFGVVLRFGK